MSIPRERIERLFKLAEKQASEGNQELADRYVELARKISERTQEKIPGELKKRFCSECDSYLVPGENCRVRSNPENQKIIYTCKECGEVERYDLEEE